MIHIQVNFAVTWLNVFSFFNFSCFIEFEGFVSLLRYVRLVPGPSLCKLLLMLRPVLVTSPSLIISAVDATNPSRLGPWLEPAMQSPVVGLSVIAYFTSSLSGRDFTGRLCNAQSIWIRWTPLLLLLLLLAVLSATVRETTKRLPPMNSTLRQIDLRDTARAGEEAAVAPRGTNWRGHAQGGLLSSVYNGILVGSVDSSTGYSRRLDKPMSGNCSVDVYYPMIKELLCELEAVSLSCYRPIWIHVVNRHHPRVKLS